MAKKKPSRKPQIAKKAAPKKAKPRSLTKPNFIEPSRKPRQKAAGLVPRQQLKKVRQARQNLTAKNRSRKEKKRLARNQYLSSLPNQPWKKLLYRLHPKNVFRYWFSVKGLMIILSSLAGIILLGSLTLAVLYLHYRRQVPENISELQKCIQGQNTEYYDRTGTTLLWTSQSDVLCQPSDLDNISPYFVKAIITAEDKNFFNHSGFEASSIIRAGFNNIRGGKTQGGSTITQQYVKNAILKDSERELSRKFKELILAIEIERSFSKQEILEAYLNTISFGSVYNGVEAASRGYFNKPAKDLTLDESALLVAVIPAPSKYWRNNDILLSRRDNILDQMLADTQISQEEYDQAIKADSLAKVVESHSQYESAYKPHVMHFVLEAERRLEQMFCPDVEEEGCQGVRLKGYKVITTLDIDAQELAYQGINGLPDDPNDGLIATIEKQDFDNAASVAVDVASGKVLAHVGSRDFNYPEFGQVDIIATQRSPGSTYKLFSYGALIEQQDRWGAGSILFDEKTVFDNYGWAPDNFNKQNIGPVTIRQAFKNSLNVPAVKAMYLAGMDEVHQFARQAGIETPITCKGGCGLASAIGGGSEVKLDELANAYGTFSRGGIYTPLTYIDEVRDSQGNVLRKWRKQATRVIQPDTSYIINKILSEDANRAAKFHLQGVVAGVKTGTDNLWKNNLIVGYSKSVVFANWFGNHDETFEHKGPKYTFAPRRSVMKHFIENYHANLPEDQKDDWLRPSSIQSYIVDLESGYVVGQEGDSIDDLVEADRIGRRLRSDIFPQWYQPPRASRTQEVLKIDIVTNKLATDCTPPKAIREKKVLGILPELPSDDPFYENWMGPILERYQSSQTEIVQEVDDLHKCSDIKPEINLNTNSFDLRECHDSCRIIVDVLPGTHPLQEVNFLISGRLLETKAVDKDTRRVSYTFRPQVEGRQNLRIEVVDEALYSDSVTLRLSVSLSEEVLRQRQIRITKVTLSADKKSLEISWSKLADNLLLKMDGACRQLDNTILPDDATSLSLDLAACSLGDTSLYIVDDLGTKSNSKEIEL